MAQQIPTPQQFESSAIFGGTGTRVNEFFDVSMIQKEQSSSIKTISAPGRRQSDSFTTMDDFFRVMEHRFRLAEDMPKNLRHYQLFKGDFSVQKDLWFEREVIAP